MKLHNILIPLLFISILSPALAKPILLQNNVDQLAKKFIPEAYVGMVIRDANTGKVLFAQNSDKAFSPASNSKLLTAVAALLALGRNYHYNTSVFLNPNQIKRGVLNGNLYFKFSGDPSLRIKNIDQLVAAVQQAGIQKIDGDVILDNTRFSAPQHPMGAMYEDIHWYYNAPATSIIVHQNYVTIHLNPAQALGKLASVSPIRNTEYLPEIYSHVKTVSKEEAAHHCRLALHVDQHNKIALTGCWPIYGAPAELNIAVQNPNLFAANIIQEKLKEHQIKLAGKIKTGPLPKNAVKLFAMHRSLPLVSLLNSVLKDSNNIYSRAIGKTLGEKIYHHGTLQEGANAIRQIIQSKLNVDLSNTTLFDAAGARYSLVTPQQISDVLYRAYHSPIKQDLINALAKSGKHAEGTLKKDFIYNNQLPDGIYAKTGSMKGIATLSGYIKTKKQGTLIFSLLVNHMVGRARKGRLFHAAICQYLAKT